MTRALIIAGMMLAASPAIATGPAETPPPAPQPNFIQKLFGQQRQQQAQAQAQGQSQQAYGGSSAASANATGGAGGNASNAGVNVRTKNTTIVAPSFSANGDSRAFSFGGPGFAIGLSNPTEVYRLGQMGIYLMQFQSNRPVLYGMCGVRDALVGLGLMGIRCDLARRGLTAELAAWEAHVRDVTKPKPVKKVKAKKARAKRGCGCR